MILGYHCHNFVVESELNVTKALERINSRSFYFGITERWEESICLFHKTFGGETRDFELMNNRKQVNREDAGVIDYKDIDHIFVPEAMKIFESRLEKSGCIKKDSAHGNANVK